jgi:hypothetical protein
VATDPRGACGYACRRPGRDDWFSADEHAYAAAGGRGSDRHSHANQSSWRDAVACHAYADDGCRHADAISDADSLPHANADWYAHAYVHPHADPYADTDWNGHTHRHTYVHTHFHAYRLCNADRHTASHYRYAYADTHTNTDGHPDEYTNAHGHAHANPHEHTYADFCAASICATYHT